MRKVNQTALEEVLFDLLSDNGISFRTFALSFYKSRVYNKESFLKTLDLLRQDVINTRVIDSKNDHPDMLEEFIK